MIGNRVFVDTNVLVYAYDQSEWIKQERALAIVERLVTSQIGAISVQVLNEFFVATTRKIASPLSVDEASIAVEDLLQAWTVLDLTWMIVLEATRGVRKYRLSFWDALIWATARLNQIPVVFSEDLAEGAQIEGVRTVNPFAPGFDVESWAQ